MIYGDILKYGQAIVEKCTNSKRCLLYLILFRLLNCLVVQTSFFPDEYAQSIEISHYWVFGYGHKPWEWEPCISLRSVVHPLTTSSQSFECILNIWGVYFISKNYLPAFPAKGGMSLACSSESAKEKQSSQSKGGTTVVRRGILRSDQRLAQECHPFRSIISSDDASTLLPAGAAEYGKTSHHARGVETHNQGDASTTGYYSAHQGVPHNRSTAMNKFRTAQIQNLLLSLLCSSFCVLIRPNAAPFWLCVYFLYLVKSAKGHKAALRMEEVLIIGVLYTVIFFLLGMIADSYYYNKITISFVNFFLYNFVSGQNSYFGEHPIHFYLSCVIPSIYLLFTPFTYYAFFYMMRNVVTERSPLDAVINRIDHSVYVATLLEVLLLSLSVHKEHKLLIGYMPFITICTGFLLHMGCIFFFSRVHNSSPEKVATYFRNLKTDRDKEVTILMTDCYDTPLYSHIHRQFKIGFLDCSPHIRDQNGHVLHNWRKKIYDNNFGTIFYDLFDETKRTSESVEPYIIPDKNFHWFGHKNFNTRKQFEWVYERINFSCLHYRFLTPLNGELPLYLVTTSERLPHLARFLSEFKYHLNVDPIFSHFALVEGGRKLEVVNHLIFKRGSA
ncbi:mannosyltransferase-III [Plasmodium cynomolgi strain B]|uniref:Mannosyltransferase n=1 Tax=Plasmodium cynomolgi (strain B) TaxID=1120755 RepID=K6ULE7_PLACD|nr:mannosyltransferase-III [Plasmodium cynomolgi strain B]GAB67653.1 mannosyltransferase-III [Plasmodium cynomolgi strain B]